MLTIALLNLILGLHAIKTSAHRNSVTIIYWASFFYFFGIPYTIDSLSVFSGLENEWGLLLSESDINYPYDLQRTNMFLMGAFVLSFNSSFFIGSSMAGSPRLNPFPPENQNFQNTILSLGWLGLVYFLATYNHTLFEVNFSKKLNGLQQISTIIIMLSSASAFFYIKSKKTLLTFAAFAPTIILAFALSERPYFLPVIGVILCTFTSQLSKSKKGIFTLIISSLIFVFILNLIRQTGKSDAEAASLFALIRDSSTSVLYYIFSYPEYYSSITEGNAIKFMLITGITPESIFGARSFSGADIPSILAFDKFGWAEGTIHPTLYGWAFVDAGFYAVIFAWALGFLLSKTENKLAPYSTKMYSAFIVSASIFLFVAFRGSVQVGYAKSLYISAIGFFLIVIINFFDQLRSAKKQQQTKRNTTKPYSTKNSFRKI